MSTRYLSNSNTKLRRDGIYSWGIPAFVSADGRVTCPGAGKCAEGCYARVDFYHMRQVREAQERRLALTLDLPKFEETIADEIRARKIRIVRVHDSGDFYSQAYLESWMRIMETRSRTRFYAYTKMIPLFMNRVLPDNFTVIYSLGGKFDRWIDVRSDKHAAVFSDEAAIARAGYVSAAHSDLVALSPARRIGLIYHGNEGRAWTSEPVEGAA